MEGDAMNLTVLDCETIALPEAEIRAKLPAFDPLKVPLGNATKEDTIARIIAEAEAVYGDLVVETAALDPDYGQVAIVGALYGETLRQLSLIDLPEDEIINRTFESIASTVRNNYTILGWNVRDFDMSFLVRRAWILGIRVPPSIFNPFRSRYPWNENIVDLMEVYKTGRYRDKHSACNSVARSLGIPCNNASGKDFAELWRTNKDAALAYNEADLRCTYEIAKRLLP